MKGKAIKFGFQAEQNHKKTQHIIGLEPKCGREEKYGAEGQRSIMAFSLAKKSSFLSRTGDDLVSMIFGGVLGKDRLRLLDDENLLTLGL